jgi:hypothetical protein
MILKALFYTYVSDQDLIPIRRPMVCLKRQLIGRFQLFSSLYKYLTEEVEDENGEPYFYRNVMKKVATQKEKRNTCLACRKYQK